MSLGASVDSDPTTCGAVFDLTVLKQLESELATVQVIVETFQAGTYGQCIACGIEIDRDLLRSDPLRTTCEAHEGLNAPMAASPDDPEIDRVGIGVASHLEANAPTNGSGITTEVSAVPG